MKKFKRNKQHGGTSPHGHEAANVPNWKAIAIVHHGPHTQNVVELLMRIFGVAGGVVGAWPLPITDGTVLYAAAAAAESIPKIIAAIEGDPSAKQNMNVIEPNPEQIQKLDQLHGGKNWPVLPAPALP